MFCFNFFFKWCNVEDDNMIIQRGGKYFKAHRATNAQQEEQPSTQEQEHNFLLFSLSMNIRLLVDYDMSH